MEDLEEMQQQVLAQQMALLALAQLREVRVLMARVQLREAQELRAVREQQHRVKPLLIMLTAMLIS